MTSYAGITTALAAIAGLALAFAAQVQAQDQFNLSGDRLAVYNLAGDVTVERGSGTGVVVHVETGGDDADELTFETGNACGANALRIIYPDDDIVYPGYRGSTETYVSADGTFYGHRNWHRDYDWGCADRGRRGRDRVRVGSRGRGLEAYADLRISVPAGKTIEIYLAVGSVTATNISGTLIVDAGAAEVEVRDGEGETLIDTGSGRIDLVNATGTVILDTGSGNVDARHVTGDMLLVDTGSGGVDVDNATVRDLNIDTGSGSVRATNIESPDVLVDTGSGSVDLDHHGVLESLNVDTGSGSVGITLDEGVDARVEIDTGSGGIDIDFPLSVSRWQRTHVSGVIGDGDGRILIDTGSGGVTIRQR